MVQDSGRLNVPIYTINASLTMEDMELEYNINQLLEDGDDEFELPDDEDDDDDSSLIEEE